MYVTITAAVCLTFAVIAPAAARTYDTDFCNKTYCEGGDVHTMCKFPDMTPGSECYKIYSTPLTDSEIEELLEIHNMKREYVASGKETNSKGGPLPMAADMGVLTWDDEIAKIAQRWALQCTVGHDDCRDLRTMAVGQNVALRSYDPRDPDRKARPNMTDMPLILYAELEFFEPKHVKDFTLGNYHEYGHLVQWLWSRTYKLGCGYSSYASYASFWSTSPEWYRELLICNYGPSGNYNDEYTYLEGPPCSKCPEGTTCGGDSRYPSLCSADNGDVPESVKLGIGYFVYESSARALLPAQTCSGVLLAAAAVARALS